MKLTRMADSCPPLHVQRAAMMISETIPMTIMLMPAAQGALSRSFETYAAYLGDMGLAIPGNLPAALALTTTAAVAGLAKLLEHGISPEEYNVRALASIPDVNNVCCATRQ